MRLFDRAVAAGNESDTPLAAIDAPMSLYPGLGDMFWHVPIEDSGAEGVVRLVFGSLEARAG